MGGLYAVYSVRSEAGGAHRAGSRASEVLERAGLPHAHRRSRSAGRTLAGWTPVASANSRKLSQFPEPIAGRGRKGCTPPPATSQEPAQVPARLRVSISSRPAVADVRRQWGMEDLGGLEIELGDAVEYPLAGPE
jgi:hypothetical protein